MGTSPRTRGKHGCAQSRTTWIGNIPAHAGKTAKNTGLLLRPREHPRARGENKPTLPDELEKAGTSPRTRGKLPPQRPFSVGVGNIPAHAGKTAPVYGPIFQTPEHPRARGENAFGDSISHVAKGTSPRTRGKQHLSYRTMRTLRNIPAHAGKTVRVLGPRGRSAEHPRARGENDGIIGGTLKDSGTSPRTRGKRLCAISFKIATQGTSPRTRGKPACAAAGGRVPCLAGRGTSPRTRGKPWLRNVWNRSTGNIPAHAGKTFHPRRRTRNW